MKKTRLLCGLCFLLTTVAANAGPILIVAQPGDAMLSTPTGPSINLGGAFLNFDSLTPFSSFGSYTQSGITISSPDGLSVLPYSTQSGPNELFDNGPGGTANINISVAGGTSSIGFGVADSDPVSIMVELLGKTGNDLGSFLINLAATESAINTGNGYYVFTDAGTLIYGVDILQTVSNGDYSGLAIDDVQDAPEPASFAFLLEGLVALFFIGYSRSLKRA
jgi:hypothetical protein